MGCNEHFDGGVMMKQQKVCKRLSKAKSDQAMEMLLSGDKTLSQIAEELGVPLRTMADWATDPATLRRAFSFSYLNNVRTALFVGAMRPNVSMRLFELAKDGTEDGGETARKACVDLLKLDYSPKEDQSSDGESQFASPPPRLMRQDDVMQTLQMLSGLNTQKEAYRP